MHNMTGMLRRFPGFPQPVFAPPGEGAGGGEESFLNDDDFDFDGPSGDDELDDVDPFAQAGATSDEDDSEEDGINVDPEDILGQLFGEPESKTPANTGGNNPPGPGNQQQTQGDNPQEIQRALAEQLNQGIGALNIAEDVIPEDFNPADPKQLREVLKKTQQATARAAINLMFVPVQAAIGQAVKQMRLEMQQSASSATGKQAATQMLEQHVPAYRSPKLRPLVNMIFDQSQKRFPGDLRAQVAATRKGLKAMGVSSGSSASRGSSRTPSGASKTGGLDLYAPVRNAGTRTGKTATPSSSTKKLERLLAALGE
jgi:hypothetical protein